jgi:hypothetical protein
MFYSHGDIFSGPMAVKYSKVLIVCWKTEELPSTFELNQHESFSTVCVPLPHLYVTIEEPRHSALL